jgi:predicted transcriptional regulator
MRDSLSRRERQILDILYRQEKATAAEVREQMADPPSYSAVRAMLRILEDKGHVKHQEDGVRYVYVPVVPREQATSAALRHLVDTFFGGSAEGAVAALLDDSERKLSDDELDRLSRLIKQARQEGR